MNTPPPEDAAGRASRIAAGLIVLLIFVTPAVGFLWLRRMSRQTVESGVLSHARDMLIRHFARTMGEWPRSWDDLAEDFKPADANYDTPSLAAMRDLVEIDFDLDVSKLEDGADPGKPFRVLWLKDRPDTDAVAATNARLREALCKRQSIVGPHRGPPP